MIKLRRMKLEGHVARMGEKNIAYRLLVRKPEVTNPLERSSHRWVYNEMKLGR
jgi:hypothetical protein